VPFIRNEVSASYIHDIDAQSTRKREKEREISTPLSRALKLYGNTRAHEYAFIYYTFTSRSVKVHVDSQSHRRISISREYPAMSRPAAGMREKGKAYRSPGVDIDRQKYMSRHVATCV